MRDAARSPRRTRGPARDSRSRRVGGRRQPPLRRDARYLRFATPKPYLTERELDFLLDIDHHRREAILAVDPGTGHGVAVVRYVEISGEPDVVEIAATVADDWQGQGLGQAPAARITRARRGLLDPARQRPVYQPRSINMLRRAGFAAHGASGILREYELALDSTYARREIR